METERVLTVENANRTQSNNVRTRSLQMRTRTRPKLRTFAEGIFTPDKRRRIIMPQNTWIQYSITVYRICYHDTVEIAWHVCAMLYTAYAAMTPTNALVVRVLNDAESQSQ